MKVSIVPCCYTATEPQVQMYHQTGQEDSMETYKFVGVLFVFVGQSVSLLQAGSSLRR